MTKIELEQAVNARLAQIEGALELLTDEQAANMTTLFPVWASGVEYPLNYRVQYQDKLYKCVQSHTSQIGWEPPAVPALWVEIPKPGEIPVWKQPTGAQDAYMMGNKVHFPAENDPVYVSTMDYNVYAPNVYGWELET